MDRFGAAAERQIDRCVETLIKGGVRSLRAFGYPSVTEENILTDYVYSAFFKRQLQDTRDDVKGRAEMIEACDRLLRRMPTTEPMGDTPGKDER